MTKQTGLINIICGCGQNDRPSGGGAVGGALGSLAIGGLLLYGAYRFADAALAGARESTAEANRTMAWALAIVVVLVVAGVVGWVLIGRRRDVKQAPQVQAWTEATNRALAARQQAQLPAAPPRALPAAGPRRIEAQRLDRIEAA